MGAWRLLGAVLGAIGLLACGSEDHPANLSLDSGVGGHGGTGGTGMAGASGSAGAAGSACQPDPTAGSTLSGDVIIYDPLFKKGYPGFAGQAEIRAVGTPCGWVSTTYDGAAPVDGGLNKFTLSGVKQISPSWVRFYQLSTDQDVASSILPVDALDDLELIGAFGFFRKSEIDPIYTATGVPQDPTRATIVAQLIDGYSGAPAAGGVVAAAVEAQVAYPTASSWQLGGSGIMTDSYGVAVLLNVPAQPFPGELVDVTVTVGSTEQKHSAAVEAGAVTWLRVLVGFAPP